MCNRVLRKVTQDVFIFEMICCMSITPAGYDAAERLYQMIITREMRRSSEYKSEFNMICLCCYSHIPARHEE